MGRKFTLALNNLTSIHIIHLTIIINIEFIRTSLSKSFAIAMLIYA